MAGAIALLVASSLLPLVAGQAAQQWLDTLTLHSARLVLRLSTLADGDDPVGGGQKMSIVLTEAACFNIRVGHGHGETALDSHVEFGGGAATGAAAGADGGSGSISGWTQLVVAFREVDFTCHFGRVEGCALVPSCARRRNRRNRRRAAALPTERTRKRVLRSYVRAQSCARSRAHAQTALGMATTVANRTATLVTAAALISVRRRRRVPPTE